jgi:hypothetical protein
MNAEEQKVTLCRMNDRRIIKKSNFNHGRRGRRDIGRPNKLILESKLGFKPIPERQTKKKRDCF